MELEPQEPENRTCPYCRVLTPDHKPEACPLLRAEGGTDGRTPTDPEPALQERLAERATELGTDRLTDDQIRAAVKGTTCSGECRQPQEQGKGQCPVCGRDVGFDGTKLAPHNRPLSHGYGAGVPCTGSNAVLSENGWLGPEPAFAAPEGSRCGAERPSTGSLCVREAGHVGHHMTMRGNGFDVTRSDLESPKEVEPTPLDNFRDFARRCGNVRGDGLAEETSRVVTKLCDTIEALRASLAKTVAADLHEAVEDERDALRAALAPIQALPEFPNASQVWEAVRQTKERLDA